MRIFVLTIAFLAGCGNPRTRDEIFAERESLPQVYVGLKTHKKIVAPARKGVFVDPETDDEFWPAMECSNPDCPNRNGSTPVLFVLPRSAANRGCPHCLKKRNLKSETPEVRAKYESFVAPFVLPETKTRLKQLDDEFNQSVRRDIQYRRN